MPSGTRWDSSAPIRYPDPDVRRLIRGFAPLMLGHAAIERIAAGCRFTEGRCGSAACGSCCSATSRTTG